MDATNREIWTDGVWRLKKLALEAEFKEGEIRPQQVSPISKHAVWFGPENPLPMVPDFCGNNFGKEHPSVLICGSAYAGFIQDYSGRPGITAEEYAECRGMHDKNDGGDKFIETFKTRVISRDAAYYGKLFGPDGLMGIPVADLNQSHFCLTDLCKVSLVRMRKISEEIRKDRPGDKVIRADLEMYKKLVEPEWIYNRMIQADLIIALGSLAEQGLAYSFCHGHTEAEISLNTDPSVTVSESNRNELRLGYLHNEMRLSNWREGQCWVMTNKDRGPDNPIKMRPVHHPICGKYPHDFLSKIQGIMKIEIETYQTGKNEPTGQS
jgi:hypothetical protein